MAHPPFVYACVRVCVCVCVCARALLTPSMRTVFLLDMLDAHTHTGGVCVYVCVCVCVCVRACQCEHRTAVHPDNATRKQLKNIGLNKQQYKTFQMILRTSSGLMMLQW